MQVECPGGCNAQLRRARDLFKKQLDDRARAIIAHAADPDVEIPAPPEPVAIAPEWGEPVYCWRDRATIHRELSELEDLGVRTLQENDGHRTGPDSERVGGTPGERSLSPSVDSVDELVSVLRRWELIAVEGRPRPRRGFLAMELTTVTDHVQEHFTRLIGSTSREPLGPDHPRGRDVPDGKGGFTPGPYLMHAEVFAREIRRWHRQLVGRTKSGTGRHQKNAIPCPRCGRYSLVWIEGEDFVRCQRPECGRPLLLSEYDAMVDVWPHVEHSSEVA
jgi:hypothetical protein